jgi:hypothetical protein
VGDIGFEAIFIYQGIYKGRSGLDRGITNRTTFATNQMQMG